VFVFSPGTRAWRLLAARTAYVAGRAVSAVTRASATAVAVRRMGQYGGRADQGRLGEPLGQYGGRADQGRLGEPSHQRGAGRLPVRAWSSSLETGHTRVATCTGR
jgi:hypothetical protein